MRFDRLFSSAIVGATVVLMVPQIASAKLSSVEIGKIAEDITVLIDGKAPGSGVTIEKNGNKYTILTARHVVASPNLNYKIVTPDGERHVPSRIQALGNDVDLALVEFTSNKSYKVAKIGNSDQIPRGTICYLGGFPGMNAAFSKPLFNFTEGKITGNSSQPMRDGYALVYDNTAVGGMSGGPVLNDKGELIGIHGRGDSRYDELTEQITASNFKLGIPINTFVRMAGNNQVALGVATIPPKVVTELKAEDFFVRGVNKSSKGDYQGAIVEFNQAISRNPKYVEALTERGYARSELKDSKGAIEDFTQAIKINPNYADAYKYRGVARGRDLKDLKGAIEDLSLAIKNNPKSAQAYYNRGLARSEFKDNEGALQDYTQAIKINPNYIIAYNNRGVTRSELKDYEGAIKDYTQVIKMNPKYADAYYNRGNARGELNDYESAIQDYTQAIKINPQHSKAYNNRGIFRRKLKDYQGAIQDYNQLIKFNPNDADAYYNRGLAYKSLNNKQKAIADFQTAAQLYQKQGKQDDYRDALSRVKELQ
jgi:tetratricopeptide (TPR) repeat protein